jgi:hypothetical protein
MKTKTTPYKPVISKFISDVSAGNYASADTHLTSIIQNKLLERINNFKNLKIFNNHERN